MVDGLGVKIRLRVRVTVREGVRVLLRMLGSRLLLWLGLGLKFELVQIRNNLV